MRALKAMVCAIALWCGAAAPASALSYVKLDPRYNGMYVAGCPTADLTRCIQTNGPLRAASVWCRAHGMGNASNYKTDAVRGRGGAVHMETGTACNHPNCLMFLEITCASSAAARPAAPPAPAQPAYAPVRINTPHVNGVVVDWCTHWASRCGAQTAYLICQRLGYRGALNYALYRPGRTYVIGANRYCYGANCTGFSYVTCAR